MTNAEREQHPEMRAAMSDVLSSNYVSKQGNIEFSPTEEIIPQNAINSANMSGEAEIIPEVLDDETEPLRVQVDKTDEKEPAAIISKYSVEKQPVIEKADKRMLGDTEMKILLVGLDAAGKTSILYALLLGEVVTPIPTIGFNFEEFTYKNISFHVWDLGGRDKNRTTWRDYYTNTQGIIFVVDSNDRDYIDIAREELHKMIKDEELKDAILLVYANKQDLPRAMTTPEITEKLQLHTIRDRRWFIQATSATRKNGLYEGLDWLSQNVPANKSDSLSYEKADAQVDLK